MAPGGLPAVYAEADALALVSTYEPFGVTMREGAAAGLPLLCSGARAPPATWPWRVRTPCSWTRTAARRSSPRCAGSCVSRSFVTGLAAGSRAVTERHPLSADAEAWERAVLRLAR